MNTSSDTPRIRRFPAMLAALSGLAIAGGSALAQEQYEWEPDTGYHEEEWYDPSDWFDDDWSPAAREGRSTTDYEELGDDDRYDAGYNYNNSDSDFTSSDYDGYYDGYYDGFNDKDFGIDFWDSVWDSDYRSNYTSGYYDGYYDSMNEYKFEPTYYVYGWTRSNSRSDAERRDDEVRSRGDRSASSSTKSSNAKHAQKAYGEMRVRGTIDKISQLDRKQNNDHVVLRLAFDNGKSYVVDFGPKMTRKNMPISEGERVTISGDRISRNDRQVVKARSIVDDGQTFTLRGSSSTNQNNDRDNAMNNRDRMNSRDRDVSRRDR